ncbi:MAG: hypothetical protein FWE07_02235 [Turicibacter sp.]|nr:hypothetical protein [Turicibacter sp.]
MFTYKGKSSKEMNLRVVGNVSFASPSRDVRAVQVPGRDGDLMLDNGRFNSVVRSIPCRIEPVDGGDIEALISRINNWLSDDGNLHEFGWDNDPDFKYLARVDGGVVSQRILSHFGTTAIDFRMHPIKYLRASLNERPVTSGTNVANPFSIDAKPRMRIVRVGSGEGDVTIHVGGRPVLIRGLASGCIIDSDTQTITNLNGTVTLFSQMRSPFPVLRPGDNQITFPANVQVQLTPRLGALL